MKEELGTSILGLDEWMTAHDLKFDLRKNDKGEWNDEADIEIKHIFRIVEE